MIAAHQIPIKAEQSINKVRVKPLRILELFNLRLLKYTKDALN